MAQTARSCTTSILIQAIDPDTFECVPDEQIPLQGEIFFAPQRPTYSLVSRRLLWVWPVPS